MDDYRTVSRQRISRDELYALVWTTPMNRLGTKFGISGNGLAKICDRLEIPYPPPGYWAKKEAGKPVITFKLPPKRHDVPEWVDIEPTPRRSTPLAEAKASAEVASAAVVAIPVSDRLDDLHPKVKAWLAEHKREQKEREQEHRKLARNERLWARPLLDELSQRDLYRFRVTNAIFKAVEKAGGKIQDTPITGKVTFLVSGRKVECSIVEKMQKPLVRPQGQAAKWTAYPDHHQTGLQSSGFLRVTITTYLGGKQFQWIETPTKKVGEWLPEITGAIIGASEILAQLEREREESERRWRDEEARRREVRRQKELDAQRWARFREKADNWGEHARLVAFIAELRQRLESEGDVEIGDRPVSEWILWAQTKADALDPFHDGLAGFFASINR
jgi:hypothetical protein